MEIQKEKIYYTVPETAKILRISQSTLNRRVRSGGIKSRKFGSRVLFRIEDIENSVVEVIQKST
ncbi:helix-turn-helix domain-containing protein [Urechidicola vernalis]|uniref:helix-turn-helix domain-containing protein n=1 Tax=Urechidicola vernalis TaxID=3075600 RepID=UPI003D76A63D